MDGYELLEENRKSIIERFSNRDKVKRYFDINKNHHFVTGPEDISIHGIGEEVMNDLDELFKLYNLEAVYLNSATEINHGTWWYSMTELNNDDLNNYLPIFFKEFSVYPVTFIRKLGLNKIYFVNSLIFSTNTYSQYRAAVPDYSYSTMAMIYCCKEQSQIYIKNVIHHELFHFIDYIEDGLLYGPDPDWESLNTPNFTYGDGGANNRVWKPLELGVQGFLNFYSTTGVEEDKAEIFSFLMNSPDKIGNHECHIINKKLEKIINLLERFDSLGVNQNFWKELMNFRENYYN
jgi:hypothetical protein